MWSTTRSVNAAPVVGLSTQGAVHLATIVPVVHARAVLNAIEVTLTGGAHGGTYRLTSDSLTCSYDPAMGGVWNTAYQGVDPYNGLSGVELMIIQGTAPGGAIDFTLSVRVGNPTSREVARYEVSAARGTVALERRGKGASISLQGRTAEGVGVSVKLRCDQVRGIGVVAEESPPAATAVPEKPDTSAPDAAHLAELVLAGGDSAVPALMTALRTAGLGVIGTDRRLIAQPAEPSQGLAFEQWEVKAMAEAARKRISIPLATVSARIAADLPGLSTELETLILDGIRTSTQANSSTLRFWARFVVELGRHHTVPYDLLAPTVPSDVHLDAVQFPLVLRRLGGDLIAFAPTDARGPSPAPPKRRTTPPGPMAPEFQGDQGGLGPAQGLHSASCKIDDTGFVVLDAHAVAATTVFEKVLESLAGAAAVTIGNALNAANFALAISKLAAVGAALEVERTIDPPSPLKRTKSREHAGELRTFTAVVRMNVGSWEWVNCIRPTLNALTGLDIDLPNDGVLPGARVEWKLIRGGVPSSREAIARSRRGEDIAIIQIARGSRPRQLTNDRGVSEFKVEGTPQRRELKGKLFQAPKEAAVRVNVTIEGGMGSDLLDALAVVLSGPIGTFTAAIDFMLRMPFSFDFPFPVIDWQTELRGTLTSKGYWSSWMTHENVGEAARIGHDEFEFVVTASGLNDREAKRTTAMPILDIAEDKANEDDCAGIKCEPCHLMLRGSQRGTMALVSGEPDLPEGPTVKFTPHPGATSVTVEGDCPASIKDNWRRGYYATPSWSFPPLDKLTTGTSILEEGGYPGSGTVLTFR